MKKGHDIEAEFIHNYIFFLTTLEFVHTTFRVIITIMRTLILGAPNFAEQLSSTYTYLLH
jgi:hypothetical protein